MTEFEGNLLGVIGGHEVPPTLYEVREAYARRYPGRPMPTHDSTLAAVRGMVEEGLVKFTPSDGGMRLLITARGEVTLGRQREIPSNTPWMLLGVVTTLLGVAVTLAYVWVATR